MVYKQEYYFVLPVRLWKHCCQDCPPVRNKLRQYVPSNLMKKNCCI
jgi:hypothetical protein